MQDIILVIPEDQATLTEEELQDDQTCILRASDPEAADNISLFNYEEKQFKIQPATSQMAVHFERTYA
jgi:hypothetical protein